MGRAAGRRRVAVYQHRLAIFATGLHIYDLSFSLARAASGIASHLVGVMHPSKEATRRDAMACHAPTDLQSSSHPCMTPHGNTAIRLDKHSVCPSYKHQPDSGCDLGVVMVKNALRHWR